MHAHLPLLSLTRRVLTTLVVTSILVAAPSVYADEARTASTRVFVRVEHPSIASTPLPPSPGLPGELPVPPGGGGRREPSIVLRVFSPGSSSSSSSVPPSSSSSFSPPDALPHPAPLPVTHPAADRPIPSRSRQPSMIRIREGSLPPQIIGDRIDAAEGPRCTDAAPICLGASAARMCGDLLKAILSKHNYPTPAVFLAATASERISWLLWIFVVILLGFALSKHLSEHLQDTCVEEIECETHAAVIRTLADAGPHRVLLRQSLAHGVLVALVTVVMFYGFIAFYEGSRAEQASIDVAVTIAQNDLGMSCDDPVDLGTIDGTGDTDSYHASRATRCTVVSTSAGGYILQWRTTTNRNGTLTGSLIHTSLDTAIRPFTRSVNAPAAWSLPDSESAWAGRLSSMSTTVDTATWGTDGAGERWQMVHTGSTTIARRNSRTDDIGDTEYVGFRAGIGAAVALPDGTYQGTVVFTAIAP